METQAASTRHPTPSSCRLTHDSDANRPFSRSSWKPALRTPSAPRATRRDGGLLEAVRPGDGHERRHLADARGELLDLAAEGLVAGRAAPVEDRPQQHRERDGQRVDGQERGHVDRRHDDRPDEHHGRREQRMRRLLQHDLDVLDVAHDLRLHDRRVGTRVEADRQRLQSGGEGVAQVGADRAHRAHEEAACTARGSGSSAASATSAMPAQSASVESGPPATTTSMISAVTTGSSQSGVSFSAKKPTAASTRRRCRSSSRNTERASDAARRSRARSGKAFARSLFHCAVDQVRSLRWNDVVRSSQHPRSTLPQPPPWPDTDSSTDSWTRRTPRPCTRWIEAENRGFHHGRPRDVDREPTTCRSPPSAACTASTTRPRHTRDVPVATVDGWPTGLSVPGGRSVDAWAVSAVTVSPTHRRRGIARALMEGELANARNAGAALAMLDRDRGDHLRPLRLRAGSEGRDGERSTGGACTGSVRMPRAACSSSTPHELARGRAGHRPSCRRRAPLARSTGGPGILDRALGLVDRRRRRRPRSMRTVRYDDEHGQAQGFVAYRIAREAEPARVRRVRLPRRRHRRRRARALAVPHRAGLRHRRARHACARSTSRCRGCSRTRGRSRCSDVVDHLWVRILDPIEALGGPSLRQRGHARARGRPTRSGTRPAASGSRSTIGDAPRSSGSSERMPRRRHRRSRSECRNSARSTSAAYARRCSVGRRGSPSGAPAPSCWPTGCSRPSARRTSASGSERSAGERFRDGGADTPVRGTP